MQRRKDARSNGGMTPPSSRAGTNTTTVAGKSKAGRSRSSSTSMLMILMAVMMMLVAVSVMSPSTMRNVEEEIMKDATIVEKEVENWLNHVPEHPPQTSSSGSSGASVKASVVDATAAMEMQPSKWVEGEKKLKQQLKILELRQKQGKDLGVPTLTRYLGEDFPAWAGEGVDKAEWEKKRDAMYAQMKVEEEEWKKNARNFIEAEKRLKQERRATAQQTATQ